MADTKPTKKKAVDITENDTYVYTADGTNRGFTMPDSEVPESKKTAEWYVSWVHYISSFYNVDFNNTLAPIGYSAENNTTTSSNYNLQNLPVNKMLRYMQYYQGRQDNVDYNAWVTGNVADNNMQAQWIKGQDVAELINFMKGNMLERISNLQITAKALSENAVSEYQDYRTKLLMKYKFKDIFNEMAMQGASFEVGPQEGFESEDAIDDFMDKNFKQYGVDVATAMAKHFWYTNHCLGKFLTLFVNACVTGVASAQHYVQNGKQYMRTVPSYQLILDTRHDDDFNRSAQFRGIVESMTPNEIFARFKTLSESQKKEIKEMSKNQDMCTPYNNGFSNFNWWNFNLKREEATIAVVTTYFTGPHDMRLKKAENKFGDTKIEKAKEDENGEYVLEDLHRATLIGNRYLVEWGYDDNVVEDFNDKSQPLYPLTVYLPNMVGGEPRSIVSRIHQLQDEIDALKFKVRESIGRAKGKCYIIRDIGGNNVSLEAVYKDLGSMGVTVIPSNNGEQDGNRNLLEMVDWTLDPNIMRIEEVVRINRDLMKEYTSVSNVSLGMQTTYMGMGERAAAIGQATYGLASLYHGFMDFIQMNLQYAVNVGKHLYTMEGGETEAAFVIGDKGVMYLKIMENLKFEDFLIMLQLNDVIDEQGKKDLQQLALGWAQTGVVSPEAYLKVRKQETYSGAEKALEYEMKKKERQEAAIRAEQAQQAQAMQAQNNEALLKKEALTQSGQDNREAMAADAKKDVAFINKIPTQQQGQPAA